MSELTKNINNFFKSATRTEINTVKNEITLTEHLDKVLTMFYVEHKDIDYIAYTLGYSRGKIEADLKLIRKKLSRLI